jgi:hypothetical protein
MEIRRYGMWMRDESEIFYYPAINSFGRFTFVGPESTTKIPIVSPEYACLRNAVDCLLYAPVQNLSYRCRISWAKRSRRKIPQHAEPRCLYRMGS